jgi:hypothetical protein
MITQELLKERYNYDPLTGLFTNRVHVNSNSPIGAVAGTLHKRGYVRIAINGKQYPAHRLAWLYHYGQWPEHTIDHRNQIKDDNRIDNLRDVTLSTNCLNRGKPKGYTQQKSGRYIARTTVNGVEVCLGTYDTPEEAHQAYINAKQTLN